MDQTGPVPLRERTPEGKQGYRDGVRSALRIAEEAATLDDVRAVLKRIVAVWEADPLP